MFRSLQLGQEIQLTYPESTHCRLWNPWKSRKRRLVVHGIRDLIESPLTVEDIYRRPYLLRSRWLLRAFDIEANSMRQFYLGSSIEYQSPMILHVGLYEPGSTKPSQLFGRGFDSTPEDRALLIRALRRWSRHDFGEAQLRVFAADMRLIG